ncbi:MAG: hypothetical protein CL678_07010 [Bdellovibrionaceae bacterium]|nr:hypothetical protein [Pseudobdellovibrionaceae bacterium]|tara:strand:- start:4531 stop:5733 length:1203 start_codon:yes stop_codon:yes gene_type:complete
MWSVAISLSYTQIATANPVIKNTLKRSLRTFVIADTNSGIILRRSLGIETTAEFEQFITKTAHPKLRVEFERRLELLYEEILQLRKINHSTLETATLSTTEKEAIAEIGSRFFGLKNAKSFRKAMLRGYEGNFSKFFKNKIRSNKIEIAEPQTKRLRPGQDDALLARERKTLLKRWKEGRACVKNRPLEEAQDEVKNYIKTKIFIDEAIMVGTTSVQLGSKSAQLESFDDKSFSEKAKLIVSSGVYCANLRDLTTDTAMILIGSNISVNTYKNPNQKFIVRYFKTLAVREGLSLLHSSLYHINPLEDEDASDECALASQMNHDPTSKTENYLGYNAAWSVMSSAKSILLFDLVEGMLCKAQKTGIGHKIRLAEQLTTGIRVAESVGSSVLYYVLRTNAVN